MIIPKGKQYNCILVNFPNRLTEEQDASLRRLKVFLNRLCVPLQPIYGNGWSIALISSQQQIASDSRVSLIMPREYMNKSEIKQFNKALSGFLWEIQTSLKQDLLELNIVELKIVKDSEKYLLQKAVDSSDEQIQVSHSIAKPRWAFKDIELNEKMHNEIMRFVSLIENSHLIFDQWGLRSIEPSPKLILNLHGPSGTGKTITAHAIANHLGKPIIELSYAQIESKYVGEGPKNLRKFFSYAKDNSAVLFFDEADSLLGKRITNVTEGSEQAINSMRSQMLLEIDRFAGVAIFATNLIENYDFSFNSRLFHIGFELPDDEGRKKLLERFLVVGIPGREKLNLDRIVAQTNGFSGRDLRDLVIFAATRMSMTFDTDSLENYLLEGISSLANKRQA